MNLIFDIICIIFLVILLVLLIAIITFLINQSIKKKIVETNIERKERFRNTAETIFLICIFTIITIFAMSIFSIPLFNEFIHICPQNPEQILLKCY